MKKQILISLLSLFSLSVFAQIPNYVPANGLVGWWPFNGNANDESGNGNNGTVNGATLTSDRFGMVNSAYGFNSGNITINNFNLNLTSNYSVSFWANPLINLDGNTVAFELSQGVSCNNNPMVGFWNNDLIYSTCSNIYSNINMGSFVNLQNLWSHFTVSLNNGITTVTKNGSVFNSGTINWPNIVATVLTIGNNGNTTPNIQPFKGKIDDFGIWNRALTQCEIQNLYQSQVNNVSQAISAGADQSICAGDNITLNGSGGSAYQWNNNVVEGASFAPTQTATYTVNGTDSLGCSGLDTVMVTVLENAASTQNQTALDSYTLNGQTYTQSGTYTQTVPAANGCDSVITLNLTLNFSGISENTTAQISISPNPASSKIIVKSDVALIGSKFIIYDALGKEVKSGKITTIETEVDLSNLYNGVYLFKVGARQLGTFKIIKE